MIDVGLENRKLGYVSAACNLEHTSRTPVILYPVIKLSETFCVSIYGDSLQPQEVWS